MIKAKKGERKIAPKNKGPRIKREKVILLDNLINLSARPVNQIFIPSPAADMRGEDPAASGGEKTISIDHGSKELPYINNTAKITLRPIVDLSFRGFLVE